MIDDSMSNTASVSLVSAADRRPSPSGRAQIAVPRVTIGEFGPADPPPRPAPKRPSAPSISHAVPRVRAAATAGLCAAIRRAGAEPGPLLSAFDLSEDTIDAEPLEWLDLAGYCSLLEQAADRCGLAALGWDVGLARGADLLGDLAEVVDTAPTLAAGLATAARCFAAFQEQTRVTLDHYDGRAVLSYQIRDGRIVHRRQDAELSLGALIGLLRRTLGPHWRPEEIHLEHDAHGGRGRPAGLEATPVYGDQRVNAIVLSGRTLATVMPGADACRHGLLLRRLAGQLRDGRHEDFVGLVLQHIRDALVDGKPGIAPVAARLGLSGPALYRRLAACGVDYSDLQRDLRRELALGLVAEPDVPLTEVALRLGYSELSAFSRAFRSWTGSSPRAYRRRASLAAAPRIR